MVWIYVCVGALLGIAIRSVEWFIIFSVIGTFIGLLIENERKQNKSALTALQGQIKELQSQLAQMGAAINALRGGTSDDLARETSPPAVPPSASPPPPSVISQPAAPPTATSAMPSPVGAVVPPPPLAATIPATTISAPVAQDRPVRPIRPAAPKAPTPPSALELLVRRWIFGGNPIVKIGVLILFLGLAFLLRYASEHVVVPVELRYAGVAAAGIVLLVLGWHLRHKADNYGLILQGAGVAVMYLTPLAAMRLNDLLPPELGFAVLVGVAVLAAILAILQDSVAMAVAGTLGGYAAPLLVSTGHDAHLALFLFLTILNLGIVAVAWFKAWRVLNLIGFAGTFILGLGWANKFYVPALFAEVEPFLLLFFAMYVLVTFLFARRVLVDAKLLESDPFNAQIKASVAHLNYVDGVLAFGVPCGAFSMQYVLSDIFTNGPAFSALGFGLFYAVLALMLFRKTGLRTVLLTETLIALAVIFGSLAIPLGLDQTWTSAAWAIEAAGVYWIGIRQARLHGRLFALVVLLLAAGRSLISLRFNSPLTAIDGSALGCLLLAGSAGSIAWMMRSRPELLHPSETNARPWVIGLAALFLALLPFTLWHLQWASPALAVMGVMVLFFALRWSEQQAQRLAWLYQALAGVLFLSTLHLSSNGTALENGFAGLLMISLIGASMLACFGLFVRQRRAAPMEAASFGVMASIGLLVGIVFLNVAPLFVLSWHIAAMIWPLSGVLTLWWAVRTRHLAATVLALILQVVAGIVFMGINLVRLNLPAPPSMPDPEPFMHSGFWGPILISLAAFVCAWLLYRNSTPPTDSVNQRKGPVAMDKILGAVALSWAVAWWSFGWADEIHRVVPVQVLSASLVALTIISGLVWSQLANRLRWRELGLTTLLYIPALILIASHALLIGDSHPLISWAMLAWPLALVLHVYLLRQQGAWIKAQSAMANLTHVAGSWLFVVQAAIELRWRFADLGEPGSAWPLLGWMIAPVAYLSLLTLKRVQHAWPVRDHRDAYLISSAMPVAGYLIGWIWISNLICAGSAAPLPYIPIVNPLEIAHLGALLGVILWFWPQRLHASLRSGTTAFIGIVMATGLALMTGMVARSCHHWGDVQWDLAPMLASQLFQTSVSVMWSAVAITLMLIGNRRRLRPVWLVGASLIAVVVVKLFVVELAAHGSLARIVSFIVVGVLLLVVGYFAPLPPRIVTQQSEGKSSAESEHPV